MYVFITGTGTEVGKTVLTAQLVRHLRESGVNALAIKPLCSGGRGDAELLQTAQSGALTLDEINPWHYPSPVTPFVAGREIGNPARLPEVIRHIQEINTRCDVLLIEGAGGLLSPLGEDFSSSEIIDALDCRTIVVAPNRLGVINEVRLTVRTLAEKPSASIVLMDPSTPDESTPTNRGILESLLPGIEIHPFPRLSGKTSDGLASALNKISQHLQQPR